MNEPAFPKFRAFYDSLVRMATSKGIILADAQDLAGDTIERALAGFDPARGEFPAFCHTILSNLMKNYWRDRKKTEEYPDPDGPVDPDPPIDPLELADTVREIQAVLSGIKKKLSTEENAFLKHLQEVLDESGPRAISEAARRSGLTPAKGWDLFRKIQRKVREIPARPAIESGVSDMMVESYSYVPVAKTLFSLTLPSRDTFSRITPDQMKRVESLLP